MPLFYSICYKYNINYIESTNTLGSKYPENIFLNALNSKDYFIHNLKYSDSAFKKYIANKKIDFYRDKISDVCNIANSNSNSIESVAKKIEILDNVKNNLKKNLNVNLVIDKMIIDMCGDY